MQDNFPLIYTFHFYLFGVIALASSIAFVTRRSPVAAAMWLVTTMFALSALFVMLGAQFLGTMQILVYAGAIMVVFLFVVMLLNLGHPSQILDTRPFWGKLAGAGFGVVLIAEIAAVSGARLPAKLIVPAATIQAESDKLGAVGIIAKPLFTDYLLAFELTSVVLLVAIAGAVVLGKKKDGDAR